MRHFLMPKEIKQGDRIIIWGAGYMGKSYLSQAKAFGVKVVMLVDQEADLPQKRIHTILPVLPNKLKEVDSDSYDYVLIAIYNIEQREYVKKLLNEYGIDDKKIISSVTYYDDVETLYNPEARLYGFPHFSWYGEDMIISNIFSRISIENPSYLDVGCNEPYLGSNTAWFYFTGSRGVCIDANAEMIEKMKLQRADDISLCIGITPNEDEGEENTFFIMKEKGLSSFDKSYVENYSKDHSAFCGDNIERTVNIKTYSLSYVVNKWCDGVWPDFLDLDVEGLDDEIMKNTSFGKNGPKVICVESHSEETRKKMKEEGYFIYTVTLSNDIYVRNEYRDDLIID